MTNSNENKELSLINVDELLSQIAELLGDRGGAVSSVNAQQAYLFLLLIWGYFEVSIVETKQGTTGEGGETTLAIPKIIQIEKAYQIFDYGSYLKTSPGKYYGSYTTGPLLITVKAMIELLVNRGAKSVKIDGLAAAKRFASIECEKNNIKIADYKPDIEAQRLKDRLPRLDNLRTQIYPHSAK